MWLAPLLIALACAAAAAVTFGNDPRWIHVNHGLAVLLIARRLLWPLMTLSVLLCVALLGLVIASRRSAVWLIGLLPVVLLLGKRLSEKPTQSVLDNPSLTNIADVTAANDQRVVGLILNDQPLALPCAAFEAAPAMLISAHDKRAIVLYNAAGNRALAFGVARELKAKDLEVIATPGGVPLIYDSRLGQFIVGETGLTPEQTRPIGFLAPLPTEKTTLAAWRAAHADTKVLPMISAAATSAPPAHRGSPVMLIAATQPAVIENERLNDLPLNFKRGDECLLLLRDATGRLRAFDRRIGSDLFPKFSLKTNRKLPEAALIDSDTASAWTIDGRAIAGPLKGQKLKALPIETDLDWPTLKFWQPGLTLTRTDER